MAKVDINSPLIRKKWLMDGLLNTPSVSFWLPYTGNTSNSIIYQSKDENAKTGHTVTFDFKGKLTGKAIEGDNVLYGTGEIKRKFSDSLTMREFNHTVDNGSKFDAVTIGDLSLAEHSDSREGLADLFIRFKDQVLFDTLQGVITPPTHIYNLGNEIPYNSLLLIEDLAKKPKNLYLPTANGAIDTTAPASKRAGLKGVKTSVGKASFLCILDTYSALAIKSDENYQNIIINSDVRGDNNRAIDMVVGKLGKVLYVEGGDFAGFTDAGTIDFISSEIEEAGLRQYALLVDGTVHWSGQAAFDTAYDEWLTNVASTTKIYSRNLLLGQSAGQIGFGMMPDYKIEWGDFQKTSQSLMEEWMNAKKTNLTLEMGKDYANKISNIDFGVIALDLQQVRPI